MKDLSNLFDDMDQNYYLIKRYFSEEIFPKAIDKMNGYPFKRMASKLTSERLPKNERNLTDVRTRVGTLLEYQLAIYISDILQSEYNLKGYTASYVLANQYPDLVIRNEESEVVYRIEVKSIQSISEEKSANFDAPVRNINPKFDLVLIMLWEWEEYVLNNACLEFPRVEEIFSFYAFDLAILRDINWLKIDNKKNKKKIIDISNVFVPSINNVYKIEEHNMGKLMRIDVSNENSIPLVNDDTPTNYNMFKNRVYEFGFKNISKRILEKEFCFSEVIINDLASIGYQVESDKAIIIMLSTLPKKNKNELLKKIIESPENKVTVDTTIFVMTLSTKFNWALYQVKDNEVSDKLFSNNKPKGFTEVLPLVQ